MELELSGQQTLVIEGKREVVLPSWMTLLDAFKLDQLANDPNRSKRIVAAGRDPVSRDIVAMNGDGDIFVAKPEGNVYPYDERTIAIKGIGDEMEAYQYISAETFLKHATRVTATYGHEDIDPRAAKDDP